MSGESLEPGHFNHIALPSANPQRGADFYCQVLGFRVVPRPAFSFDGRWLYRAEAGVMIHLIKADGVSQVHSDGVSQVHSDGVSQVHSDGVSQAHSDGVSQVHSDGVSQAHSDGVSQAHSDGVSQAHSDGVSQVHSDGVSQSDSDSDSQNEYNNDIAQRCPPAGPINTRGYHFAMQSSDVTRDLRMLAAHGVETIERILPDHGYRQVFFRDPDGNVIEIGEWPPVAEMAVDD